MAKTKRQLLIEFMQDNLISVEEALIVLLDLQGKTPIKAKNEDKLKAVLGRYENRKR